MLRTHHARRPAPGSGLILGALLLLAAGCSDSNSGGNRVRLSGVVDDGGTNSPIPAASCVYVDDLGPTVGPVTADANGRFSLSVPRNSTGRVEGTPPGKTDLVLVQRVAVGLANVDLGEVNPESSLLALILEREIEDGELDPAQVAARSMELAEDDALASIATALDIVVDALVDGELDLDLLEVVADLHDNGRLDDSAFASIAVSVNTRLEAEIDGVELVVAIEELADLLFEDTPILTAGKLLIEHNATDEDTGFQGFADGDPWNQLEIRDPEGTGLVQVEARGGLLDFGLTELFFETSEPPNDEVAIPDVLARLEEGDVSFAGELVDGDERRRVTEFTHDIPAGPVLLTPADGATGLSPDDLLVSWEAVTEDFDGEPLEVVGYQVIVEEDAAAAFPAGFARPLFTVFVPASATRVTVPNGFLKAEGCYAYEVLAIEASGNQTLSSAGFETGEGCEESEDEEPGPTLTQAKVLIEHNTTDEDTGFQCFGDGDPWNTLSITGPDEVDIVEANAAGGLFDFGLTEFFFETSEPPNDEVPIASVLARLAEGTYTFRGAMVEGGVSTLTTEFTHTIPAGPVLLTPADGVEDADPEDTVVSWQAVTTDVEGSTDIEIVGYQVIVELDEPPEHAKGFYKPLFSIYLPASTTSIRIPAEFLLADADYEYEVLAIEASGNQTLSSAAFSTE